MSNIERNDNIMNGTILTEAQQETIKNASLIKGAIMDVMVHDSQYNMHADKSMIGLLYMTNCLVGEAGEVANVVKKLYRDGTTPERIAHLHEEIVDVMIYLAEMVYVTEMDFDAVWEKKHEELRKRWEGKK